jgi:hypothetical protein
VFALAIAAMNPDSTSERAPVFITGAIAVIISEVTGLGRGEAALYARFTRRHPLAETLSLALLTHYAVVKQLTAILDRSISVEVVRLTLTDLARAVDARRVSIGDTTGSPATSAIERVSVEINTSYTTGGERSFTVKRSRLSAHLLTAHLLAAHQVSTGLFTAHKASRVITT